MPDLARQDAPSAPLDRYRPAFHFTPRKNWMNDPNGLVYFEGEYHLFYQYNPLGSQWGHMSWGHAVSPDLLHWTELPVAIPETDVMMIFSGCAVVDHDNVSGLGDGNAPPLLAFFTAFDKRTEIQSQHLAYSHDRGRTFTHYRDNPLIDLGLLHFRDPKVFYHATSHAWVMVVALSREHRVLFYRSTNLIDWAPAGEFGLAGSTSGQWECPDLMLVPIEDEPAAKWVLKVDVDDGFIDGGSGAQYFVGDFDGCRFIIDTAQAPADGDVVDFGPDFYAAVSWSDLPPDQPGPVWIGWMSNHQTGRHYPTEPWRGAQSLPRRLFLFRENGTLKLGQRPIDVVSKQRARPHEGPHGGAESRLAGDAADGRSFSARIVLPVLDAVSARVQLRSDDEVLIEVSFDRDRQQLNFVRLSAGGLPEAFARQSSTSFDADEEIRIEIYVDDCLVEIFVNGGERVYSGCIFPSGPVTLTFNPRAARMGRVAV